MTEPDMTSPSILTGQGVSGPQQLDYAGEKLPVRQLRDPIEGAVERPWTAWEGGIVAHSEIEANVICLEPERMMKASLARWPANAEFIVRACNSHDDLVAALQKFVGHMEADDFSFGDNPSDCFDAARRALSLALGESK